MDKYQAIDKYESKINELEKKKEWVLSTLQDNDVRKRPDRVMENIADLDIEIAIYIDIIETLNNLEFS